MAPGLMLHYHGRRPLGRVAGVALALLATACGPPVSTTRAPVPAPIVVMNARESLRLSIDSLLRDPNLRNAFLGVLIVNPRTSDTLYSLNAGKLFMPASNQKILTGAVALTHLGPEYRYRTTIAKRGSLVNGVVNGDLLVIGNGDPTISDRARGKAMTALLDVADSLAARGVRRVTGKLMSGGNVFTDGIYGYGWEADDFTSSSGAPVDELFYNEGLVDSTITIGGRDTVVSVVTRNPSRSYLAALDTALSRRGIVVSGGISDSVAAPVAIDTLYSFQSSTLRDILRHFEKPSQNQIGELLLKTMGLRQTGVGVADSGAAVVSRQLLNWGAEPTGFKVYDGSGLSRHNLVSPETLVRVLVAMRRDTAFSAFYNSLPIAGIDGTLRSRMKGSPAENNMHAKTGTLEFVRSLSGYITSADGEQLVFSLLSNHFTVPVAVVTRFQDAVGAMMASYRASPTS